MNSQKPFVVAITGASGACYAKRLVEVLLNAGHRLHIIVSPAARQVMQQELQIQASSEELQLRDFLGNEAALSFERLAEFQAFRNFSAGVASGSYLTAGMVICPCSMGTLAAIAHGLSDNLIQRAADVHLKEHRRLILVPRETPLSAVQLRNMTTCAEAGAVVLPAMPAFYGHPRSLSDAIDFVVGRVCDQLGVQHQLLRRWGTEPMETG